MIVRKLEALFTINTDALQFKRATSHLDGLASKVNNVMTAFAGFWAVQALQNSVSTTAKSIAEIGKNSEYLGIAAEAMQQLHYAAEKSGVSIDAVNDAIKEIQVRAVDAQSGQGEAAEAFKMLGLSSTDAAKRIREPLELLDAVADRLQALPSHSQRIWIADAIFGDEGSTVLKMLKDGSAGLHKMRQEAQALGVVLGSNSITQATRFNEALNRFNRLVTSTGQVIVQRLLPPLSWLMEKFVDLTLAFREMEIKSSWLRITLLTVANALALISFKPIIVGIRGAIIALNGLTLAGLRATLAMSPMLLVFGIIAAALVTVALIIDDLWVGFQGGESVIFKDVQKCVAFFTTLGSKAAEVWTAMSKGFQDAWASIKKEFSVFSTWIIDQLNKPLAHVALLPQALTQNFVEGFAFIEEKLSSFQQFIIGTSTSVSNTMSRTFSTFTFDAIGIKIKEGIGFIQEQFAEFGNWIANTANAIKQQFANLFDGLVPDFVKNGFLATIKHVSSPTSSDKAPDFNTHLAPTSSTILNHHRLSNNQSVNVAVNLASNASPRDIGGEVVKALRKELERERFNAFMGVTQYAG